MNEIEKALVVYDGVYNGIGNYPYYDLVHTALKEKLTREQNEPLTLEKLKGMDGEPYWHKSLIGHEDRWMVLDPYIAKYPEEYHYGETWLAYRKPNK